MMDEEKTEDTTDQLQELENQAGENDLNQMDGPIVISCPEMHDDSDEEAIAAYKQGIEKDLVSLLAGEIVKRESWRRQYETLWWNLYSLYVCGQRGSTTPTRSKIFVPIAFQLVEIATPKLISFNAASDSMFGVKPDDPKNQDIADNIKRLLQDQLDQNEFDDTYENFVKQLLLYGTSYFYVDWKVQWDWVWERVAKETTTVDNFGINHTETEYINQKSYKILERRPNISFLDVLDVFPQQDHAKVKDQNPGVCIRRFMDKKEFERLCDGPQPFFGNKEAVMVSGTSNKYQESRQFRKAARGENATSGSTDIELLEWWMRYDLDGDGIDEECHVVIANRQVVVRAVSNPYYHQKRPLIKVTFCKVPGEWYGIGLIEPVISLINQLVTIRRQRLDNITLILNRMWKVKSSADIDPTKLVASPNGIVLVDDMTDIEPLEVNDVTQQSNADANQILADIFAATVPQSITGSMDDMKGTPSNVGAVRANIAQALEKFATAAKAIQNDGIKPMLNIMYQLDLQYLNTDEVIRAFYGKLFPDPMVVSPEMIRTNVTFTMTVLSEMVNTEVKIAQTQAFYTIGLADYTPDTKQMILQKIWGLMGNNKDEIRINNATAVDASGRINLFNAPNPTPAPAPAPMPTAPVAPPVPGAPAPINTNATASQGAAILRKAMAGDVTPTLKGVKPLPTATGSE